VNDNEDQSKSVNSEKRDFTSLILSFRFFATTELHLFLSFYCLDEIINTNTMADSGGQSPLLRQSWYVYLVKGVDGSSYTGCTNDLANRIKRHNQAQVVATRNILPVEIVTYIVFTDKYKAYAFEKYLKLGSGRAFSKRHLI
jgi:putative endonuclease